MLNNTLTWVSEFGLTVSMINSLQTGTPYTSERNYQTSLIPNNVDKPIWFNSDARVYYQPFKFGADLQLFLQVDNIFDVAAHWGVYSDTGLATESTELSRRIASGTQPGGLNSYYEYYISQDRLSPPRSIKVGLSFKF